MPLPMLDKANKVPIATIQWFVERKNGKVVESQIEIQRRFGSLDWSVQDKAILAFLHSGKENNSILKSLANKWGRSNRSC